MTSAPNEWSNQTQSDAIRRRHPQELRGDDECTGGRTRKGSARSERKPTAIESHAA